MDIAGAAPVFIPSRGGHSNIAALPQRGVYNPDNPTAPQTEDMSTLNLVPLEDMDQTELQNAAKKFESHFLAELLKVMRKTVPESGLFGQGFSQRTYTEMLDQEYAKLMTDHGGIGLASMLELQLQKDQDKIPAIQNNE